MRLKMLLPRNLSLLRRDRDLRYCEEKMSLKSSLLYERGESLRPGGRRSLRIVQLGEGPMAASSSSLDTVSEPTSSFPRSSFALFSSVACSAGSSSSSPLSLSVHSLLSLTSNSAPLSSSLFPLSLIFENRYRMSPISTCFRDQYRHSFKSRIRLTSWPSSFAFFLVIAERY